MHVSPRASFSLGLNFHASEMGVIAKDGGVLPAEPLPRCGMGPILPSAAFCTCDLPTGQKWARTSLYGGVRGPRPGEGTRSRAQGGCCPWEGHLEM